MPNPNEAKTPPKRGPRHEALQVFLGEWRAQGHIFGGATQDPKNPRGKPMPWHSTHTASWHSGRFFLTQDERALTPDPFDTLSITGWDDDAASYYMHTFENHGFHRRYEVAVDGNSWTILGETERARIVFSADGKSQTLAWEWRPHDLWLPLCDRVATRL
jgi:hypothetical protein